MRFKYFELFNISMMLNKCIIQRFSIDVTTRYPSVQETQTQEIGTQNAGTIFQRKTTAWVLALNLRLRNNSFYIGPNKMGSRCD